MKKKEVNVATMICYYGCTLHSIASNNNAGCVLLAGIASNNNAGSVLLAGIQRCKKNRGAIVKENTDKIVSPFQ